MERQHVEVFRGVARLKDAHTVSFLKPDGSEDEVTGDIILIATGSSPFHPPDIPFDNHRIYDSDSILRMKMIPKTMVVIGGGVIGCEYACTFSALGVQVTLVESSNRILLFVDSEIADRLRMRLELLGLRVVFNDRLQRAEVLPDRTRLELRSGEILDCEIALIAAGAPSKLQGIGVGETGRAPGH